MLLHRHPQAEMQGAPRFGQLQHHPRATPLPEQLFAQRPAAAADRLHGEDEARLRQPVAVAAAAPAELVVGGVLEGRGGSAELVCARTRLLALSLELELAQLDAGGGGRRISACFRSFATRWRRWRAFVRTEMYILSIQIHPHYSRDLRAHARRPLRLSTSSQSSENTPKSACRRLLRQAARAQAQERERVDACAHTQARPTHPGPRAPHRRQVLLERRRQQPPVVEAELHLLHVDDLLQPPVAARRVALAAGWRADGDVVGRSPGHLAFLPAGDDGAA